MKNTEQERSGMHRWALRGATIAFVVLLALFLITLAGFFGNYADKLADFFGHGNGGGLSGGGHFARNLGLALLALGGIAMAAWRNREMSRQADAALDQNREMSRQADAAQEQIKNEGKRIAGERFSDGVKMLAQNNEKNEPAIAARVGGIYALQSLVNDYASKYAAQVVKTLIAYVRENSQSTKIPRKNMEMSFLGEDVKVAFAVLAQLLDARDKLPEKKFALSDNDLDFSECNFSRLCLDYRQVSGLWRYRWQGADFRGADLQCADFKGARMHDAQLQGADLRGANLERALLHNADLRGASLEVGRLDGKLKQTNLQGAKLRRADLRGAAFSDAPFAFVIDYAADLSCADLNDAKLQDTDLRKAVLSGVEKLPALSFNQIWHSKQPGLQEVRSIEMSPDRVWNLEPYRDCPYALAGVLRNYTIIYNHGTTTIPSSGLLEAARRLLNANKLPLEFSENGRKWLKRVDLKTGIHPDLREKNPFSHNWRVGE